MANSSWTGSSLLLKNKETLKLGREDFPSGFTFGVSTSAYQIEGAALEDGKGMNIWDSFSHIPGNIYDGSTGDVTCDHYHRYEADVQLMVELGIDAYRFSISWSRIFPDGNGNANQRGVAFYNKLINTLLSKGIEPYVVLYHWDMPLVFEDDPGIKGWRTKEIVKHFARFADTCFQLFGDRVKTWITLNEPRSFALDGYGTGKQAPGRCSAASGSKRLHKIGDSSTEPYIVLHNALLAHAAAVKIYKSEYQIEQRGRIGIAVDGKWYEPYTSKKEDIDAAERCLEFEVGWDLDPIFFGDYPESMRNGAGSRLPCFTKEESKDLQGSIDFVGYNYYSAYYARSREEETDPSKKWYRTDRLATVEYTGPDGKLIGEQLCPPEFGSWLYDTPWALPKMLAWMHRRYGRSKPFIITENGTMDKQNHLPMAKCLDDHWRVQYMSNTLQHLADAIRREEYNVQGYFAWCILDNFEWDSGLSCRFGLYYVDFAKDAQRYPKASAFWYRNLLKKKKKKKKTTTTTHSSISSSPSSSSSSSSSKPTKSSRDCCLGFTSCSDHFTMLLEFLSSPSAAHRALEYVHHSPKKQGDSE